MSITKKIIELHGGKIGYEPREGRGSRFWFTLPIKGKRKAKPASGWAAGSPMRDLETHTSSEAK